MRVEQSNVNEATSSVNSNNLFKDALTMLINLSPLFLFFILFIGSGVYFSLKNNEQAFYQLSASVAILPAIMLAIFLTKQPLQQALNIFLQGAREQNIIMMCLIYLLAGAFAAVLQTIGGIDSFVNLLLTFVPKAITLPVLFLISSLVATAMGTSMGTIAALGPIGANLATIAGIPLPLILGTIISGAMFGDNLSIISDTSIAATQIHGCSLRDKFKSNARIALPAMILTVIVLCFISLQNVSLNQGLKITSIITNTIHYDYQIIHGLPYLVVLGLAMAGINVFVVLISGILTAGLIGVLTLPNYHLTTFSQNILEGYLSMNQILILSLLMGGLSELIKYQGGFKRLAHFLEYSLLPNGKGNIKTAEASVSIIVSLSDICVANNTAAIILSGEVTKEIAKQNSIGSSRTATLVDIFSCVFQGILPYSAQILMISSFAQLSPLVIIPHVYYCYILGMMGILSIIFRRFLIAEK